jgi:hypothetical protein
MELLLIDTEGKVLAVAQSLDEVVRQLARIRRESQASEPVRVVRHDEHHGDVMSVDSFVTASPLPPLLERRARADR